MHIVLLALLWLTGIWIASITNFVIDWWALTGLCCLAAAVPPLFRPSLRRYALYLLMIASFFLGGARYLLAQPSIDHNHIATYLDQKGVTITGQVVEEPDIRDRIINLTVAVESIKLADGTIKPAEGDILLRTPRFPIIDYGTQLTVKGDLETPFESAEFSYKDYLQLRGIYGVMSFPRMVESEAGHGSWLLTQLFGMKRQALNGISRHIPAPESGLLAGILLGVDHRMPEPIDQDFSTVGITHIVVISGYNIAILSSIFLALFSPFLGRWGSVIATLVGITLFTLLVGADPSVARAALMGGVYVVTSKLIGRRNAPVPILMLAAFCMTLINPNAIWDIGFQLSFAATLSLMLYARPLTLAVQRWLKNRFPAKTTRLILNGLTDSVLVTLAAQVLTLPILLYYFESLSLISIVANAFVLPVQPLIMIWGGLVVLFSFFLPAVAQLFGWVVWVFLRYTIRVAQLLALVPFASIEVPFSLTALICVYLLIFGLTWFNRQELEFRQKWFSLLKQNVGRRVVLVGSVICIALGWQWMIHRPDGYLHVYFFDVGQGDATLIQTPSGRQILIDGGYYPTLMKQHLGSNLPLWDKQIDLLIATHPDADHVTGLPELFDRYQFDQLLVSYPDADDNNSGPYAELLDRARANDVQITRPQAGDVIEIGDGVRLEIIHPATDLLQDGRNDNSLSLRLVFGETKVLLTGDAEAAGERAMLATGLPLQANIYKAGHHGANNASSERFLDQVRPQLVIVSAGADNRFGHPHIDLLNRVAARGAKVLRTDTLGTIEIISDGENTWWQFDG